jgi:hypothetical protein
MEALRAIEKTTYNSTNDSSMEAWWRDQDNAVVAMLQAAGDPQGFMAGFVATFAEYMKLSQDGGIPNLGKWRPEAAMTGDEKAASRAAFAEEVERGAKTFEITAGTREAVYQKAAEQVRKSLAELLTSKKGFKERCARWTMR